jgi:hypothetical protein
MKMKFRKGLGGEPRVSKDFPGHKGLSDFAVKSRWRIQYAIADGVECAFNSSSGRLHPEPVPLLLDATANPAQ